MNVSTTASSTYSHSWKAHGKRDVGIGGGAIEACLNAEFKNGSVQMTIVGIPLFSRAMASCTLHAVQDPQSAMQVTTKSHCEARSSMISSAAGRE